MTYITVFLAAYCPG